MSCGSVFNSTTFSFRTRSIAAFKPLFFAHPPVSVMESVAPAFFAMTKHLFATAIWMPAAISFIGLPSPTSVMTSDSAKTVHCAVIGMTFFAVRESFENSGSVISKERAIAS